MRKIPRNIKTAVMSTASILALTQVCMPTPVGAVDITAHQLNAADNFDTEQVVANFLPQLEEEGGKIKIPVQKKKAPQALAAVRAAGDGIEKGKKGMKVREQLSNQGNFAYFGKLYIGNPPQAIECIFDTGSANPWVASRHVRDSVADFDQKLFDERKSDTFIAPEEKHWASINFGSGSLKGYFAKDTVMLGDPDDKKG